MEGSNWVSKLLFHWASPLMRKGKDGRLRRPDDLYDLPEKLNCAELGLKLHRALTGENVELEGQVRRQDPTEDNFKEMRKPAISLLRALHKCFWLQFYATGLLKLAADCATFAGPILLHALVSFIEDKSENVNYGYAYAAGLLVSTLIAALCDAHFNFHATVVGLKIRAALITTIYGKILTADPTSLNVELSIGEIVNFMSTDTDRIVNSCPSFHIFWSIPFQLVVTLYLLYNQVGFAFVPGLVFTVILVPINKVIANKIAQLSTKMMKHKDERVKMMTDILLGIRCIKIHVWEQHFVKRLSKIREAEMKYLKGRKYLDALCVYFWATTPVLISILTFGTFVIMDNKLMASTVFTTMALINMLITPLNEFPWVLNGISEAWVSIQRIQRLLNLPDLDKASYYDTAILDNFPNHILVLSNAYFHRGRPLGIKEESKSLPKSSLEKIHLSNDIKSNDCEMEHVNGLSSNFYLRNTNIAIKKGDFVGIIGPVGCGKSSIFAAIQAELTKEHGKIAVADLEEGFGLVTQQAWLQHITIRDNILFGNEFEQTKYNSVIHACCLADDLALLSEGDLTGVGEGGVTLSGGQKARVALARAVYQDKPIYLLDDIISAVDEIVAKHIYENCIMGILKKKTKILCTHHFKYLLEADSIIVMDYGVVKQQGTPLEVLPNILENLPTDFKRRKSSKNEVISSPEYTFEKIPASDRNEESCETGSVQFNVYTRYWKAIGHLLSVSTILSLTFMQFSRNLSDWWLAYWASTEQHLNNNLVNADTEEQLLEFEETYDAWEGTKYYLFVYAILAALNSLFTLFRAFFFAYGGISAASRIHTLLLKTVVSSKVSFFDLSPLGRILNRFSTDTYGVDDSLPFILNILLAQLFGVLGAVILTIYGLPWICVVLVPLIPMYYWLQNYYRLTSRELKRISSITLSPVYSHFNETLQGLPTIRAFRATNRFRRDNEKNVESNIKAQFASQVAARWLGIRLQFIGVLMVTGVGFIAVIQHQFHVADPGMVGLAVSYALSITGFLTGVVNAFTETEREMIAVERVTQYIEKLEPETACFKIELPCNWPSLGVISFNNVVLKYSGCSAPALKGITFETRPAEKIGVVGRTGAGKTSLIASLFRMTEIQSGTIMIDSVNTAAISIKDLRSHLYCIPQDPFLFSGTIKENLDPFHEFRDDKIWSALASVDLTTVVHKLGGLSSLISSGGSSLSIGQRQLFCLARAVLQHRKILCVDEATASIDFETDRLIQQTLRTAFSESTVITIAHRIQTVMDCDRVLVMGDGQVLEFDCPNTLLNNPASYFYKLANQK